MQYSSEARLIDMIKYRQYNTPKRLGTNGIDLFYIYNKPEIHVTFNIGEVHGARGTCVWSMRSATLFPGYKSGRGVVDLVYPGCKVLQVILEIKTS